MKPTAHIPNHAFTLVEVLLALTLTAIIGGAVVTMLRTLGSETLVHDEVRSGFLSREIVSERVSAVIRPSAMILDQTDNWLVAWRGDLNRDGAPNLAELLVLEYEPDAGTLQAYRAPADMPPGADPAFSLSDDFSAIAIANAGTSALPGVPLLNHLLSVTFRPDQADTRGARRVCVDIAFNDGFNDQIVTATASLRASPDIPCAECPDDD